MTVSLVRYDAACSALAAARSVDEAKHIHDTAEAMRAYAKQANNRILEVDATEIRIRAERRVGELIAASPKARGTRGQLVGRGVIGGSSAEPPIQDEITLAEVGIDKKLSSRSQRLAAISESEFEEMLRDWRERIEVENARVTTNLLKSAARSERHERSAEQRVDTCTVSSLVELITAGHKFGTIYADPPWLYDNQGTRAATGNHYGGMTVSELCDLPVRELAADDAHLHLWTTNAFLFDAPRIFEAWGFQFRSSFVWVKPQMGIGNYWRNSHEFLLTAIRGDAKSFEAKDLMSWGQYDRTRHSAKPEAVRKMLERASPGPWLELFGRRVATGWVVWGNEIERSMFDTEVAETMGAMA